MTEYLSIAGNPLAHEVSGRGPLVVLARIEAKLTEPGRMKVLRAMCKTSPKTPANA